MPVPSMQMSCLSYGIDFGSEASVMKAKIAEQVGRTHCLLPSQSKGSLPRTRDHLAQVQSTMSTFLGVHLTSDED
jgi:hypothetical protein